MHHTKRDAVVGTPIGGEFGTSVSLPRLQDVINYIERKIVLSHGYPRFIPHETVTRRERLAKLATGMPFALAFPSLKQAHFILDDFLLRFYPRLGFFAVEHDAFVLINMMHPKPKSSHFINAESGLALVDVDGLPVACLRIEEDYDRLLGLRRTWGSAFDVHRLAGQPLTVPPHTEASLCKAIRNLEGPYSQGTLLFQSGMAAISSVVLLSIFSKRRLIQIGPAYVDTGNIMRTWTGQIPLFDGIWLKEDVSPADLETAFAAGPAIALVEVPFHPRLSMPDIPMIADTAHRHDVWLCADASIATPFNFKGLAHGFDMVMHSSTKFLNGRYHHLGGVLSVSSEALLAKLTTIRNALDLRMCENQMAVLADDLVSFPARMERINANAADIARRLQASPDIQAVYYPGNASKSDEALAAMLLSPGRSGLISFLLKENSRQALAAFFDRVAPPVMKGPGFGGETSLICPYVLMAHDHDSEDFLKEQKLDMNLLRLSVGTEPVEEIWAALGITE